MSKIILQTEVPDGDECAGCRYIEERNDYWTGQYCQLFDCAIRNSKKLCICRQKIRESKNLTIASVKDDADDRATDISIEGRE